MDEVEARAILSDVIQELRRHSYVELCKLLEEKNIETREVTSQTGKCYQLEIQAFWDSGKRNKDLRENLRVMVSIDDGRWRAFHPLCADFIIAPDGSFIGES